jgi:arginine exporter protein ArgO
MSAREVMNIAASSILAGLSGLLFAAGAFLSFWLWIPALAFMLPALRMSNARSPIYDY